MAIPPDGNQLRWLGENPSRVLSTLTPLQQRAVQQAAIAFVHNILREANVPSRMTPMPAHVAQVDNLYIAQQLVPFLLPTLNAEESPLPSSIPSPGHDEAADSSSLNPRIPSAIGPGASPVLQNEVLLLLLNTFRQLLDQPFLLWDLMQGQNGSMPHQNQTSDRKDSDLRPHGKSQATPLSPQNVSTQTAIISELSKQAERAAMRLSTQNVTPPRSISGRTSPGQSQSQSPAPAAKNSDEWVFRLLSIQAAVRNAGATAPHTYTSSAEMALVMSRLFSQFAKLQNLVQTSVIHQNIFITAKTHLHAYLEFMTQLLKNMQPDVMLPQMDKLLQRAWQEEGWLRSLLESLEAQVVTKNAKITEMAGQSKPFQINPSVALDKNGIPLQKEALGVIAKEITNALSSQQNQLLQPRSTAELLSMVQAHITKNPLLPVTILMPYPMTFKTNGTVTDVTATEKCKKEQKRGSGQKLLRLGSANSQVMCLIPAGPVIVGDSFKEGREDECPCDTEQLPAFLLAATPVTNAQFASWLNEQLEQKLIEIPRPGYIYDLEGRLLARSVESAPLSQIEMAIEEGEFYFRSQLYRENHPVVHVSYWGALAFCASNGVFLPTEAQWERAGGMLPTAYGQPIQKLRYGCRTEELNHAWANYFHPTHSKGPQENRTVPVGFFDGERAHTLAGQRIETMRAASPWGCFDMSGNVREWVSEDYDEEGLFQVTKGGSYADRPFDLRLAARMPLLAESTDSYTGFRVGLDFFRNPLC